MKTMFYGLFNYLNEYKLASRNWKRIQYKTIKHIYMFIYGKLPYSHTAQRMLYLVFGKMRNIILSFVAVIVLFKEIYHFYAPELVFI